MTVTPAMVKDLAPDLAGELDARVSTFITYAALRINATMWGTLADLGTAYLTAHLLSVSKTGGAGASGAAGPLTGEAVGAVSRTFASPAGMSTFTALMGTAYGREYLELLKLLGTTPQVL